MELRNIGDLWSKHFEVEEAIKIVDSFDFNAIHNPIELPNNFFPEGIFMEKKAWIVI
jgi:hypothetical protein